MLSHLVDALVAVGAAAGASASRWLDQAGPVGWCLLALGIPVTIAVVLRRRRAAASAAIRTEPGPELALRR